MSSLQHESQPGAAGDGSLDSPLSLTEVAGLCASPGALEQYSPLGEHNYLLLDTTPGALARDDPALARVAERLRVLPCPVLAVGPPVPPPLLRGVDAAVDSLPELLPLVRNIEAQPLAAMTLVQLLRYNEESSPEQGLLAESLAYATLQGRGIPVEKNTASGEVETGEPVRVSRHGDELHIALNRPARRNAYSARMRDALYEALLLLQADDRLRRGVIRGEGSCFSIGGDLAEFGLAPDPAVAHAIRSTRSVARLLLELAPRLEFRLHRACIGAGIELPAFAGRVLADPNTFVQLPEIRMGLLPGAGGTVSITRRIGRHRTAYLALSARRVNATTAHEWGLIDAFL